MNKPYVLLTEKESMWAETFLQVLRENGIPFQAVPVYGAGLVMRAGMQERLQIYVPEEHLETAQELLHMIFAE